MHNSEAKTEQRKRDREMVYQLEGRPALSTALPLGLQHVMGERNLLVMSLTFAFGLGMASHPEAVAQLPSILQFVFSDAVTGTCIVAIIANVLFPSRLIRGFMK